MTMINRRTLLAAGAAVGATVAATSAGSATSAVADSRQRPLIGPASGDQLHVMSFNIRLDRSSSTQPGDPDHWPERAPILIFAMARCVGWLAHALEQIERGELIRPRAHYIGQKAGEPGGLS